MLQSNMGTNLPQFLAAAPARVGNRLLALAFLPRRGK